MNDILDLIGKIIILLILAFVYFDVKRKYKKSKLPAPIKKAFGEVISSISIRYNSLFKTIILPVILMAAYFLLTNVRIFTDKAQVSIWAKIGSIIIAPFWEEVFFRGIVLVSFIIIFRILFTQFMKKGKFFGIDLIKTNAIVFALLISSIIFSLFHNMRIDIRYAAGVIFGLVYLIDDRNLMPAIIAHMLNNIMVYAEYANW